MTVNILSSIFCLVVGFFFSHWVVRGIHTLRKLAHLFLDWLRYYNLFSACTAQLLWILLLNLILDYQPWASHYYTNMKVSFIPTCPCVKWPPALLSCYSTKQLVKGHPSTFHTTHFSHGTLSSIQTSDAWCSWTKPLSLWLLCLTWPSKLHINCSSINIILTSEILLSFFQLFLSIGCQFIF